MRNRKLRRIITVRPGSDTYVRVVRGGGGGGHYGSGLSEIVLKVACWGAAIWFALWVMAKLLPWIAAATVGWFALRLWARR